MSDALKPCPFCGGEAVATPSAICRETLYAYCKDHTCPGRSVSRCQPALWNRRADLPPTTAQLMADPRVQALASALQAADDYIDNGKYEMARNITRTALAQLKEPKP
jgi:hypothetical protein